ncbi:MAG TPA: ABC transporter permease, partial [Candidatus Acidoferrum sp.]|nr:ABC transporter permease [Candidatus Acidoferrum sp.]
MSAETFHHITRRRIVWNNLMARPLRSVLSVIAVSLQVILVLLIVGMTTGVLKDMSDRAEGVGADLFVQPANASIFFAFSGAVMQESVGDRIAKLPSIDEVAAVLIITDSHKLELVYGIDEPRFEGLSKGFKFLAGHAMEQPDDALADDLIAQSRHLHVGDTVKLLNHSFRISGIVLHGKGARFFVPLKTAQDVAGAEKRVSMFYVRSKGNTEEARSALVSLLPGYRVRTMAEYMTLMSSSNLPELKPFIRSFVILGTAISFLVVLLTMHTMVLERTREIGILKALGSSRMSILGLIEAEASMMACLGAVLGLILTFVTVVALRYYAPTLPISIEFSWVVRAVILAIVASGLGALYPG